MAVNIHFNEIFTKCGKSRNKAGKISEQEVKSYHKVTSCGKIFSKSTIPSEGNAGEKNNLHYTR